MHRLAVGVEPPSGFWEKTQKPTKTTRKGVEKSYNNTWQHTVIRA